MQATYTGTDRTDMLLAAAKVTDAHADAIRAAEACDADRATRAADRAARAYADAYYHARRILAAPGMDAWSREYAARKLADAERMHHAAADIARSVRPFRATAARR